MKFNTYRTLQHLFILMLFTLIYTCSAFNNCQESVTRSFSKNYTLPSADRKEVSSLYLSPSLDATANDALHYAICKRLDSEFVSCNITVETWPFAHGTFRSYCADYKIDVPDFDEHIFSFIVTTILKNGSRLLLSSVTIKTNNDKQFIKENVHLIDMSKCTKIANFTMDSEDRGKSPQFMAVYQNVIEIGFPSKEDCNGKPSCLITYDHDGKKIGETKPFHLKDLQLNNRKSAIPVSHQSPGKGYYITEYDVDPALHVVSYVDSSGEGKRQLSNWTPFNLGHLIFSSAYGHYTRCYTNENEDKTIHCAEYDTEKLRMNITIKLPNTVEWFASRDLSDGGFVLVTGSCTKIHDGKKTWPSCKEFRIQRFSADGQMYKALEIDELELSIPYVYHQYHVAISENDKNEICIFWAWSSTLDYNFTKWCVPTKYTLVRN